MHSKDFNLLWVSKCMYPAKHIVKTNYHDYYQIVFILSGEGEITISNFTYNVEVNQVYIFKPNVKHSIMASKLKSLNTVELKFYCNNVMTSAYLNELPPRIENTSEVIRNAFINIIEELKKPDQYTESIISCLLNQIVLYLTRKLYQEEKQLFKSIGKIDLKSDKNNTDPLDNVVNFINREYHKEIKLNDLADMVHLSPVYFCSVFKERYGVSPIKYLQNIRLENAKKLLYSSNESVTRISEKVGFQSVHYFSRFFKAREGITPNEFRKRNQGFIYRDFHGNMTDFS
ncbi:MAG: helix-turn-helix transcriptional regulator [Firmicutes bacterium]|nr:helix-turn-helix transcriptional regulator [Bacillota bacterium]